MSKTHRAFFGDAERAFRLTPEMIIELERVRETGIGALITRVLARQFHHADLVETIRLALIGGGTNPKEAAALVAAYAAPRPLAETYPLAVSILMGAWAGDTTTEGDDAAA